MFHVYLLRCADGTFYAGSCENLPARVATHNRPSTRSARSGQAGVGATWTAKRLPVELVYSEPFQTRAFAVAREQQLKRWSHAKKTALVAGDRERLRALAKHRG